MFLLRLVSKTSGKSVYYSNHYSNAESFSAFDAACIVFCALGFLFEDVCG